MVQDFEGKPFARPRTTVAMTIPGPKKKTASGPKLSAWCSGGLIDQAAVARGPPTGVFSAAAKA